MIDEDRLRRAIVELAASELDRRKGLRALAPDDRRALDEMILLLADRLAGFLVAEAKHEPALAAALDELCGSMKAVR